MKQFFLSIVVIATVLAFTSCARGVSPERAAGGGMKCHGKNYIR